MENQKNNKLNKDIELIIELIVVTIYNHNETSVKKQNKDEQNDGDYLSDLTQLKLQKLLYFLYGYYCGFAKNEGYKNKYLFDNVKFEAWPYGPVIKEVYEVYNDKFLTKENFIKILKKEKKEPTNDIEMIKKFEWEPTDKLKKIIIYMNKFSAWTLVEMSHKNEPWKNVIEKKSHDKQIKNNSIQEYFIKNFDIYKDRF